MSKRLGAILDANSRLSEAMATMMSDHAARVNIVTALGAVPVGTMTRNQAAYRRMTALYADGSELAKGEAQRVLRRAIAAGEPWCSKNK